MDRSSKHMTAKKDISQTTQYEKQKEKTKKKKNPNVGTNNKNDVDRDHIDVAGKDSSDDDDESRFLESRESARTQYESFVERWERQKQHIYYYLYMCI